MPPYRDPYADDKDLEDADLGNKISDDTNEEEDEFVSSVEEDDEELQEDEDDKGKDADDDAEDNDDADTEEEDEESGGDDDEPAEGEESEEVEEEESEEEQEEDEDDASKPGIPQGRFNEVNGRMRAAEERAERLENLLEQAINRIATAEPTEEAEEEVETIDVAAVEKEILELAFAGKEEEAVTKRIELDAYKETKWAEKYGAGDIEAKMDTMLDNRNEQSNLKEVITSSQADYPELKEGSDNYDQSLVDEINQIWDGLSSKMPTSVALQKAVEFVTASHGMSNDTVEKVDTKAKSKGRKKAAVKKNAAAQKRQPPKMRGRSAVDDDLDQVSASKLSDKKLFSMSEKELRILRGD